MVNATRLTVRLTHHKHLLLNILRTEEIFLVFTSMALFPAPSAPFPLFKCLTGERSMRHFFVSCVLFFSSIGHADVSSAVLERFKKVATRDIITFGAPKNTLLSFDKI